MDSTAKYIAQHIAGRRIGQDRDASPVVGQALGGGFTAGARGSEPGQWIDGPARDTQAAALLALCDVLDVKPQRMATRRACPLFTDQRQTVI